MKASIFRLILSVPCMFFMAGALCQTEVTEFDSIAIVKPNRKKDSYTFTDNSPKEIHFTREQLHLRTDHKTSKLGGFGGALLTSLTGIGSSSETPGSFRVPVIIECNDTLPLWSVDMFCPGYIEKERHRETYGNGSSSVETDETNVFFWDKNAYGTIVEKDTIGVFKIFTEIKSNDLWQKWNTNLFHKQSGHKNAVSKKKWFSMSDEFTGKSYEIQGKLRDKDFTLIQDGTTRQVWIFMDDTLACMFQGDNAYMGVPKKSLNPPYTLINKKFSNYERHTLLRLAIMSRFMNYYLYLRPAFQD